MGISIAICGFVHKNMQSPEVVINIVSVQSLQRQNKVIHSSEKEYDGLILVAY